MPDCQSCRSAWLLPGGHETAKTLDLAFPGGACEPFSLALPVRTPVPDEELLARIITSPAEYDLDSKALITSKLTQIYARGLSIIRSGAPDVEINAVLSLLLSAQDEAVLVGAVVLPAHVVRGCGQKHFFIYDTDQTVGELAISKHGDILGAHGPDLSRSQREKLQKTQRRALCAAMGKYFLPASTPEELIAVLREAGI